MKNVSKRTRKESNRIFSVTVRRVVDECPDASYLGKYSDRAENEFAIDRALDEFSGDTERATGLLERAEEHLAEEWNEFLADDDTTHTTDHPWAVALDDAMGTIRDAAREFDADWDRREFRYFNPGSVEAFNPDAEWITSRKDQSQSAEDHWRESMRSNARQDYARMESLSSGDWCYIGITAQAEVGIPSGHSSNGGACYTVQRIHAGGLWGIESDSEASYLESEEKNQLADLKDQLRALGFSTRAISKAFKEVKRAN